MLKFHFDKDHVYPLLHLVASCAADKSGGAGDPAMQWDMTQAGLMLSASNGAATLRIRLPDILPDVGPDTEYGGLTFHLPADKLDSVLKSLPKGTKVQATFDQGRLLLKAGKSKFTLQEMTGSHSLLTRPSTPGISQEPVAWVTMDGELLADDLEHLQVATAKLDARIMLNGVYLELVPTSGLYRITATDGRRLAHVEHTLPRSTEDSEQAGILPSTTLGLLIKALRLPHGLQTGIRITNRTLQLRTGDLELDLPLIDGAYIAYSRALPESSDGQLVLEANDLIEALKQVAPLATADVPALQITCDGVALTIESIPDTTSAHDTAVTEVTVVSAPDSAKLGVLLNRDFLLDAGKILVGHRWTLRYQGALAPLEITDGETRYIIMAMRG